MRLPELRLIEKVGDKYLFAYEFEYNTNYAYISDEEDKYKIEVGEKPKQLILVVEKQSKMGKDITKKINNK